MNIFMVAQLRQTDIKNSGWLWSRDLELAITLLYFSIGQLRYYRICVSHRLRTNPNSLGTQVYQCFYRKQLVAAKLLLPDHHANELAFYAANELAFLLQTSQLFMLQTSQLFMLQTNQLFMLQTSELFMLQTSQLFMLQTSQLLMLQTSQLLCCKRASFLCCKRAAFHPLQQKNSRKASFPFSQNISHFQCLVNIGESCPASGPWHYGVK